MPVIGRILVCQDYYILITKTCLKPSLKSVPGRHCIVNPVRTSLVAYLSLQKSVFSDLKFGGHTRIHCLSVLSVEGMVYVKALKL